MDMEDLPFLTNLAEIELIWEMPPYIPVKV